MQQDPATNSIRSKWSLSMSHAANRTTNPIREIVDGMKVSPNPNKKVISLALGDPTVFKNMNIPDSCIDSVINHLRKGDANGYPPAHGSHKAREAVADYFSVSEAPLTAKDVILASGCSGALELCFAALANPNQSILLPKPGFSVYQTIADSKGIKCKYYNLMPARHWEIDVNHLESLIDHTTAFILINNPSNPTGSNYSQSHLTSVLEIAAKHYLPIVSDEIYANMVFGNQVFTPLASIRSKTPVLTVGGLAKRWLVPGWRMGWILIHDRPENRVMQETRLALQKMSHIIIGSNSFIQAAIPDILANTPKSFFVETNKQLEEHAQIVVHSLSQVKGLNVNMPQGAMYLMVGIDTKQFKDIPDDIAFTELLMSEESVMTLPGKCFQIPNYFRIVTCPSKEALIEACTRISDFCNRHYLSVT